MMKKEKGITLIALVVTIVVLLILTGVSISMITGKNGIISKAQEAKQQTEEKSKEEEDKIANIGENMDKWMENSKGEANSIVPGTRYDEEKEIIIGDNKVTIPSGATISNILGEYEDIDNGLVIYIIPEEENVDWNADENSNGIKDVQEKYDQFVWVPVKNAIAIDKNSDQIVDSKDIDLMIADNQYPMAIATDNTNYRGVLYRFSEKDGKITITDNGSNIVDGEEPGVVSGDDDISNLNQVNGILNTNYSDSNSFKNELQTSFNTMVENVKRKGGFWIGRYETSKMSNSTTTSYSKANEIQVEIRRGTTTGVGATWYRKYAQQKIYSKLALESNQTKSSMMWMCQRDQIMIWMKDVKNTIYPANGEYYITNSLGMGNHGIISGIDDKWNNRSIAPTGYSDNYKVKNIYDLAGNLPEWTPAVSGTEDLRAHNRQSAGGDYLNTGFNNKVGACITGSSNPSNSPGLNDGTRIAIY